MATDWKGDLISHLKNNVSSKIENYVVPALSSLMIGDAKIRIFEANRDQEYFVTPHSHRYDLFSLVLKGSVKNTIYSHADGVEEAEEYAVSFIEESGFDYLVKYSHNAKYLKENRFYEEGQGYFMPADFIHTIKFSKDAVVLIFEGKQLQKGSTVLQPVDASGNIIPTMKVEPWMFNKKVNLT